MVPEILTAKDEELARQAQAGSSDAFEQLVCRYEHRVHGFVMQYCGNPADAREVTQDTFVRVFQNLKQFDSRRVFSSWLFTIARRQCVDHHRAQLPTDAQAIPDLADPDNPAELLAGREDSRELWRFARRHLKDIQFQTLWLHYVEDMSVAQIAQVLRKTRVHVKVLLFRARQTLARELRGTVAVPRSTSAGTVRTPPLDNLRQTLIKPVATK